MENPIESNVPTEKKESATNMEVVASTKHKGMNYILIKQQKPLPTAEEVIKLAVANRAAELNENSDPEAPDDAILIKLEGLDHEEKFVDIPDVSTRLSHFEHGDSWDS